MAVKRIGVDIGATHVRLAEVELSGKTSGLSATGVLNAFAVAPVPRGAVQAGEVVDVSAVGSAIKQAVSRGKFSSKEVIMGVGTASVVVREMDVPSMPMPQLRTSLPFQVQEMLPMSPDEAMLDFYPTAEHQGDNTMMLRGMMVAAPKSTVSQNLLAVENAGLSPKVVDLTAFALLRSQANPEQLPGVSAFVDIGARVTTVMVADNGVPRLVRIVPTGGQDMSDAVAGALRIDSQQADDTKHRMGLGNNMGPEYATAQEALQDVARTLVESIRSTFVFFSSSNPGRPVERVVLTGGGSVLGGFGQYLSSSTRLPVSYGNAFARVTNSKRLSPEAIAGQEVRGAIAVGLAFGEI